MHFKLIMSDGEFGSVERAAMVNGTKRVLPGLGFRDQTSASPHDGGRQQLAQELSGNAGHIAGDQQIPLRVSDFQGGVEAADRAAIGNQIGYYRYPQMQIALGRADQRHAAGGGADPVGSALYQRPATHREQRFVASHARAAAATEDETRASVHEKIVTMRQQENRSRSRSNKKVYICSLVVTMLAASPMRAADPSAPSSLLTPSAGSGKVSVVRVDRQTGKLVRIVSGGESRLQVTAAATPPANIQQLVAKSARAHNVDPLLVESVIQVESNYNHYAVSPKGAEGLMQLMPSTARMLGVSNSFDPAQNIEAGVKYLRYLQSVYKDDRLALAAYNAGPKAVERYNGAPPYSETRDYVNQVGRRYQAAKQNQAAGNDVQGAAAAPQVVTGTPGEEKHPKLEQSIDQYGRLVLRTAQE
jgi:hypothetical protein